MNESSNLLEHRYLDAKEYIINQGYSGEIDWQSALAFNDLTEKALLREMAWVILSSGFKESTVSKVFPEIAEAFLEWNSAIMIRSQLNDCRLLALAIFSHRPKIEAICTAVSKVADESFQKVKNQIRENGISYVQEFPYIGPITGLHLLKNLGIPTAKPDRHLVRIAEAAGFDCVQTLCEEIAEAVGDGIAEVDLVLWRYATLRPNYINDFRVC